MEQKNSKFSLTSIAKEKIKLKKGPSSTGNKSKKSNLVSQLGRPRPANSKAGKRLEAEDVGAVDQLAEESKISKKLLQQNMRLHSEVEHMKMSQKRDREKIEDLMAKLRSAFDQNEQFRMKVKKKMSTLLLRLERFERIKTIREITDLKAKLGFYSSSTSFGRNTEDWIEGVEVRRLIEQKVD